MRLTKNDSAHSFWNCGKKRDIHRNSLQKNYLYQTRQSANGNGGLSLPDITLLGPLAEILGVTVTELLQAQRISEEKTLTKPEVDALVSGSLRLSAEEQEEKRLKQRKNMIRYLLCMALAGVEIWLLLYAEVGKEIFFTGFFTIEGLSFLFGAWFLLFARETLPAFYDENKINYYSQGPFRIHIAGVYFNNRNWPHVLRAGRISMLGIAVINPLLNFLLLKATGEVLWRRYEGYVCLAVVLCIVFIPIVAVAKKNE